MLSHDQFLKANHTELTDCVYTKEKNIEIYKEYPELT